MNLFMSKMNEISTIEHILKKCKCSLYAPHILNGTCRFCSRYKSSHVVYKNVIVPLNNINFTPYLLSREIGCKKKMTIHLRE